MTRFRLPSLHSLFETNPVFKRELRARWRRPAAFLILFFYAVPLALGMALVYNDKTPGSFQETIATDTYDAYAANAAPVPYGEMPRHFNSVGDQLAVIGRDLFFGLAILQVSVWLLIAASTAAPAIAAERERGLLEALQMASLPARRVVMGKWFSTLSFMTLLFLVPLPITAICFYFGGFTPLDFAHVCLTIALTAFFASALGLYFSSRRHRPAVALRDTFLFLALWTGAAALNSMQPSFFHSLPLPLKRTFAIAELAHPTFAMVHLDERQSELLWPVRTMEDEEDLQPPFAPLLLPTTPTPARAVIAPTWTPPYAALKGERAWTANVAALGALTLLFFALAVRGATRPLPDPVFARRDWAARWKTRFEPKSKDEKQRLSHHAGRALFGEIPLLSRRSFDNPVFGRELRGKTRLRGAPWWIWIIRLLLVLGPLSVYAMTLGDVVGGVDKQMPWQRFSYLGLALLNLYAAVVGAGAFTREHEGGTWEGLKLTLLQPGQILHGKLWPLLTATGLLSLPLWPGFWLCFGRQETSSFYSGTDINYAQINFTWWHFVMVLAVLFASAFVTGAASLFISWLCRRTPLAIGLSLLCGLFFVNMPVPFGSDFQSSVTAVQQLAQPEPTLNQVAAYGNDPYYIQQQKFYNERAQVALQEFREKQVQIIWCPLMLLTIGTALLFTLSLLMRQKFREEK